MRTAQRFSLGTRAELDSDDFWQLDFVGVDWNEAATVNTEDTVIFSNHSQRKCSRSPVEDGADFLMFRNCYVRQSLSRLPPWMILYSQKSGESAQRFGYGGEDEIDHLGSSFNDLCGDADFSAAGRRSRTRHSIETCGRPPAQGAFGDCARVRSADKVGPCHG